MRSCTFPRFGAGAPHRWPICVAFMMLLGIALTATTQSAASASPVRVGVLSVANSQQTPVWDVFRSRLRDLGYNEGRNVIFDYRFARGDYGSIPRLAAELVAIPVDVIVTEGGEDVARAAVTITRTIPIVMASSSDPVAAGLVASLARPGGNLTGFTLVPSGINAKRLDLLRLALPTTSVVRVLLNPSNGSTDARWRETQAAAETLGLGVTPVAAASVDDLRALSPNDFGTPVLVLSDSMFWNHRRDVVALLTAARTPAMYPQRDYVDDGGLMAYGPNVLDNFRRTAEYVDRIVKGIRPSELPVQEPVLFDFVVNLRAARLLGVILSPQLVASASEVIE
jgi:putative ABC transport system substrate-binding protein